MLPTTPTNIPDDDPRAPTASTEARTGRWWRVHAGVALAFVLFFVFVAVLYWNWLRIQEPTAALRITGGSPAYDGAIVRVEGRNLHQPLELELNEQNRFGGRIYLQPGVYRVSVIRGDELLFGPGEASIFPLRESTLMLPDHGFASPSPPESPQS